FEQPLPSLRVHALPPYYDLDPEKFDLGDYDLDVGSQNDEVNYRGDKLFGFPTYPLNAFPPDEGQQNLLQYDYDSGCLHGLWWYQKKGSFLSDLDFRSDID
ncbi:MAG: hypothetical protein II916_04285, partial [Oscillospiraceae bacterium]|nr:hypothetical protein [Oscillospiraceae bacterium]